MAKLIGVRERHHQPLWDTVVRYSGGAATTVATPTNLFTGASTTKPNTNMNVAGQLASDQTFIIKVLRCFDYFYSATPATQLQAYNYCMKTMYFSLVVGDKPMFDAPCWYAPAGGGVWGYAANLNVLGNGVPSTESILKLAYPIPVVARQNFRVEISFYDLTADIETVVATLATFNALTTLTKIIQFFIDGVRTRDVQ